MARKPLARVAFVQLYPQGKSYAMRCDREDLGVGDEVEVCMYAGTERAYFDTGLITDVSYQRWECSCHVVNHRDEVTYSISSENGFSFQRKVDVTARRQRTHSEREEERQIYLDSLTSQARDEMVEIYEAIAPEDGEDAYLGDGIWIRADGTMDDRGR
ncbi:hypothetical protein ACQ259_16845 [Stutzerimonas stutzeri]|uniref:hypothetical protein n=1 Tax=Stutzerimonas stutzeri TaxID=316 RepID=UPI003D315367